MFQAWHVNKCTECIAKTTSDTLGVDILFISHIQAISTEIRKFYPNVNVLVWDDMMRGIQEEALLGMSKYLPI